MSKFTVVSFFCRVLQLMNLTDSQLSQRGSEKLELAILSFFEQFRKMYVGDQAQKTSKVKLTTVCFIPKLRKSNLVGSMSVMQTESHQCCLYLHWKVILIMFSTWNVISWRLWVHSKFLGFFLQFSWQHWLLHWVSVFFFNLKTCCKFYSCDAKQ